MNVGFKEALKDDQFDCFIFHDVDMIPENNKNIYLCDDHARHLSSAIDEMRYQWVVQVWRGFFSNIYSELVKKIVYWFDDNTCTTKCFDC